MCGERGVGMAKACEGKRVRVVGKGVAVRKGGERHNARLMAATQHGHAGAATGNNVTTTTRKATRPGGREGGGPVHMTESVVNGSQRTEQLRDGERSADGSKSRAGVPVEHALLPRS